MTSIISTTATIRLRHHHGPLDRRKGNRVVYDDVPRFSSIPKNNLYFGARNGRWGFLPALLAAVLVTDAKKPAFSNPVNPVKNIVGASKDILLPVPNADETELPTLQKSLQAFIQQSNVRRDAIRSHDSKIGDIGFYTNHFQNNPVYTRWQARLEAEIQKRKETAQTPAGKKEPDQLADMRQQFRKTYREWRLAMAEKLTPYTTRLSTDADIAEAKAAMLLLAKLHEDREEKTIAWDPRSTTVYTGGLQHQDIFGVRTEDRVLESLDKGEVTSLHHAFKGVLDEPLINHNRALFAWIKSAQLAARSPSHPPPAWSLSKNWNQKQKDEPVHRFVLAVNGGDSVEAERYVTSINEWKKALLKHFGKDANEGRYRFEPLKEPTRPEIQKQFETYKAAILKRLKDDPKARVDLVFMYRGHGHAHGGNALQGSATMVMCTRASNETVDEKLSTDKTYDPEKDDTVLTGTALKTWFEQDPDLRPYIKAGRIYKTCILITCRAGAGLVKIEPRLKRSERAI